MRISPRHALLIAPLLALAFYGWQSVASKTAENCREASSQSPSQETASSASVILAEGSPKQTKAVPQTPEEVHASLARLASFALQRECDDDHLAEREPRYRALFSRWKISDEATTKALEIIRDREYQKGDGFVRYLKDAGRPGSGRDLVVSTEVEDTLAEQQLSRLLGENRNRELTRLDETLDAERAARIGKHADD